MRCPACGLLAYPRLAPAMITLVTRGDRALLARGVQWNVPMYSCVAGFVEPGESLEEAVAREVHEEAGVTVGKIDYVSSQPWPFPASLMLGFSAAYVSGEATIRDEELQDVKWFSRAEIADAATHRDSDDWGTPGDPGGPLRLPPKLAIARRLIENWLGGDSARELA
jgi:NAD+ diphosphatase